MWGGPIAPPALVGGDSLIGEDEVTAVPDDKRELMKGDPLRGVHAFYSRERAEWWAPLRPDHRVSRRNALVAVLDKPSEFAERAVHEWSANVFRDDDGTMLSGQYRLMIRTERKKAREKKKYDAIEFRQLLRRRDRSDRSASTRRRPSRRGAEPRFWEDVAEGDEVGPMVKGPLTVTDMVCWHVGMGMGLYGVQAPSPCGAANRRRIPRFFHRDDQNVPDVMQRVHWDPELARRSGNPTTYDYGRMRETWLIHLLHRLDGRRRLALEARLRVPRLQLRRRHPPAHAARSPRKYLADGDRPAVDLELAADQPTRRPHHARDTPRSCCPAASTVRCACPTRPAAPATSTPPSSRSATRSPADEHLRVGPGPRDVTRRGVLTLRLSVPRSATRSTTR